MLRVGSVTGRGLKSPNESLGAFSESIDGREPVHEFSDLRVIKRMQQSPHIQLRDMKVHKLTSIVLQASQSHDRATPRIGGTRKRGLKRDADCLCTRYIRDRLTPRGHHKLAR